MRKCKARLPYCLPLPTTEEIERILYEPILQTVPTRMCQEEALRGHDYCEFHIRFELVGRLYRKNQNKPQ